ncbi:hypothetical protein FHETE_7713 [Fusarium heterosporum]|uniref:LDB19 N-terminal domain-containing protein n=1 Tax=Fusarium heterosporum TaxID=42747 RepID=A0A8H5T4G0_FUSHE|nr:hypothetical protein FHETE_7713 [Fusarium heterosporum]
MSPKFSSILSLKHPNTEIKSPLASFRRHFDASSPIVLDSQNLEGSPVNGHLFLNVNNIAIEARDVLVTLNVYITQKRPYKRGCKACHRYALESKSHYVITTSVVLKPGTHSFPFFFNVGSYLPPSMDTSLVAVTWELHTVASIQPQGQLQTIPRLYTYKRDLHVVRAIQVPLPIEPSRRLFPATGIENSCSYHPVMNKAGANRVELTLSGLLSRPGNGETIHVWKLLKGSWWIEEKIETIAKACGAHCHISCEKKQEVERHRKQTNILGRGEIYDGWTTNTNVNKVNLSFEYSLKKSKRSLSFDIKTGDKGETTLSHSLIIEVVLIKEHYPKGGSASPTRTGIARILRSSHSLFLSDYNRPFVYNQDQKGELPCYGERALYLPNYE